MTSIFSNTRFAFLARKSSSGSISVPDDVIVVEKPSATPSIKHSRANRKALKAIWVVSSLLAIVMPVVVRHFRMNSDVWFQQQGGGGRGDEATSGALRFVYAWQIVMFVIIVAYGYNVIHAHKNSSMLIGALLVWFQSNFLAMFLLSYAIEGRGMELERFYGQFSVLMFMTNAWYVVHGLIFSFVFAIQEVVSKQQAKAAAEASTASRASTAAAGAAAAAAGAAAAAAKRDPPTATITTMTCDETANDYQRMDSPPSPPLNEGEDEYVTVV
jgi:hypothetical protein